MSKPVRWPNAVVFYKQRMIDLGVATSTVTREIYPNATNPTGHASHWLYGHGRPSEQVLPLIAAALRLSEHEIVDLYGGTMRALRATTRPQGAVRQVLALPAPATPEPREAAPTPVLTVMALSNGRVRIKLDTELDAQAGIALAQTLYAVQGLIGEPS